MVRQSLFAVMFGMATAACSQDYSVTTNNPQVFAFCYENDVDSFLTCACADGQPLALHICIGQLEPFNDQVIIYDGLDETAPILFASQGIEDLSDLVFISTSPENALGCRFMSNDTISCATNGFLPIVWSVNCQEPVGCDIGVPERSLRGLSLFPNPSDGRINWRSSADLIGEKHIWIGDVTGRSVRYEPAPAATGHEGILDLRACPPGEYVLHLETGQRRYAHRFSIIR